MTGRGKAHSTSQSTNMTGAGRPKIPFVPFDVEKEATKLENKRWRQKRRAYRPTPLSEVEKNRVMGLIKATEPTSRHYRKCEPYVISYVTRNVLPILSGHLPKLLTYEEWIHWYCAPCIERAMLGAAKDQLYKYLEWTDFIN